MSLSTIASLAGSTVLTIADWVGSSVIENLVSTGFSYMQDCMLPPDSEAQLKRLQTSFPQITAIMGIAEALKINHPDARQWVEQFRQALEASKDVLDEMEYKRLEDMVTNQDDADQSASSSKKKKSCTINGGTLERLKDAVTMLDRVVSGVERLLQLASVLGLRDHSELRQEACKILRRETTSFLTEREVFGRGVEKAKIIGWLMRPTHACLSSFGIVGMGGLGKTTLVQFAYQEMRGLNHFDKTIWICVSTNFSVEDITRKMLNELGESSCYGKSLNTLHETLREKLYSKKVLLVLDDVWDDEKRSDWEQLIAPLRFVKEGSKILFTTRMKSVANLLTSVISSEHESLALQGLREQELQLLFYRYAFHGSNPNNHRDLQMFGDQIIKMLRGSPLVAKVIGSLLNSHMNHHHWSKFLNGSSIFNLEQAKDVVEVLKLSYYHLPTNLQVCFRFCSIFPQDHQFDRDELIKMWMAVGIIPKQLYQGKRPEDIGEDYFNHLLRKSFFEYKRSWKGDERYVMHDLVHELAQNVSYGECCRVEHNENSITIPSTVRHVYVHDSEIEKVFHLENLRSLVITTSRNTSGDLFVLPNNLIKKSLRLLKISGFSDSELPKEISCLVHLRYLSIERYFSRSFKYSNLDSFYKLYHLRVLEFSTAGDDSAYSRIETIGMTNLTMLRYVNFPEEIMQTIHGVHKLTSLQELVFFVGIESGQRINELGTLNNLRHLLIKNIENVKGPNEAKSANLLGKNNLMSLSLIWSSKSNPDNTEQIIDYLQPHQDIMEFTVMNYKGQRSPSWMAESPLLKLSTLKIFSCPMWKNQLFSWQMPNLHVLDIRDCPNLEKLPNMPLSLTVFRVYNVGLTSLQDLYQSSSSRTPQQLSLKSSLRVVDMVLCPNLISLNGFLQQDDLDLQDILELKIYLCEKLKLVSISAFGKLLSLRLLSIVQCQNLTTCPNLPLSLATFLIDNIGVSALPEYYQISDPRANSSSSSLKSSLTEVLISNCEKLTALNGFLLQDNIDFQSIEEIRIENCRNLAHPPIGTFAKFVSLKKLRIIECRKVITFPSLPLSLTEFCIDNIGVNALPEYYQISDSRGDPSVSSLKSSLKEVVIRNCQQLIALNGLLLQDNINFSSIEEIEVDSCYNLVHSPLGAFGKFVSLKKLRIKVCPKLSTFSSLPLSLNKFCIDDIGVNALPEYYQISDSRGNPSKSLLREVMIRNCPKLTALNGFLLQDNIDFQLIEEIFVWNCENLVHPPIDAFGKFVSLKQLTIRHCKKLTTCHSLPLSLNEFVIEDVGVSTLPECCQISDSRGGPSTSSLKSSLTKVLISDCKNVTTLSGFLQQDNIYFHSIEEIRVLNCMNLVHIPIGEFGKFLSLKELTIWDCQKLVAVDNQSNLLPLPLSLEYLDLKNCGELDVQLLESVSVLPDLTNLRIENCANISRIPCSENAFGSLNNLHICGCKKLVEHSLREQAHGVSQGSNLAFLKVSHLEIDQLSLLFIEPLRSFRSVSYLSMLYCSGMEALPEPWLLQNSSTLEELEIINASTLKSLPGTMVRLTVLKYLGIWEADLLKNLPELPASLEYYNIYSSDGQKL